MNNTSSPQFSSHGLSAAELCQRFGIQCLIVGDVYETDLDGKPIPEEDLKKWMVTAPARAFPTTLIRSIPLADSEVQSYELAVKYLMLSYRSGFLNKPPRQHGAMKDKSPAIPTAVYLAFIMDSAFWPCDDRQMVYAADLVIEVDGVRHEQHDLEPATFAEASEVIIVGGDVFEEESRLHSVQEHFESWIIGHRPLPTGEASA